MVVLAGYAALPVGEPGIQRASMHARKGDRMRINLSLELPADPEAVAERLRDPQIMRAIARPLLDFRSIEPGGFPERWEGGPHRVTLMLGSVLPIGTQVIDLDWPETGREGVHLQRDDGRGLGGLLRIQHRMAVAPGPQGTSFRDRLDVHGPLAAVLWLPLWAVWQWRGRRFEKLAWHW